MRQAFTVFYIMLCFTMGVLLLFAPWTTLWTDNLFLHHYTWVKDVARNDYFRGAVSGLGLADFGLGVCETALYRRRSRNVEAIPNITL
jgi:hypothetical protein